MKAKDAMTAPAITIAPEAHCKEAAAVLAQHRISALPVVDAEQRLMGIVSEADLVALEAVPDPRTQLSPLRPRTGPLPRGVDEVMTTEVISAEEDTDLGIIAQRMLEANVKRLPIVRGDRVVGVVSGHDLIKVMARPDEDVEAHVRKTLADEGARLGRLQVKVRDGVVDLVGDGDQGTLRLAEILARSVPGVLDVRHQRD